ncbi:MAG: type II toxin-antitoxin system HicA family toxin [Synergistaceae bacterium]|jgi:predicted RNA binding protein YcfA (HicA-like mRNA interferase family)|nr:type II toxin-antitoxin system HicA family toxin [Synergistaceae bacterium]
MGKFYSQKQLIKIAKSKDWIISEGRGKGSHVLASKAGEQSFPIPQKIKTGLLANIKKRLGIND